MKWFGPPWKSKVCSDGTQVTAPVTKKCHLCLDQIRIGERGVLLPPKPGDEDEAWHLYCLILSQVGVVDPPSSNESSSS